MPQLTKKSKKTIPKDVRIALGLEPGDKIDFDIEDNKIVMHKKAKKMPFDKWKGYIGTFKTDRLMKEIR
ncbi:AbrB/MazE/SpoVT family DNA-binding domain-containing protein [Candidatus Woesearchaeota archaeon]|nr:AbrB/MazE/SpoVT family DNA-binding domain-containing protein [Candidatus Woesearchaeota archaeon]